MEHKLVYKGPIDYSKKKKNPIDEEEQTNFKGLFFYVINKRWRCECSLQK